ncbi:hypothetical protein D9M68_727790 [compost metagenome]
MARRSLLSQCCVLCWTTSAMGPVTMCVPLRPVWNSATMSASSRSCTPPSAGSSSEGAYQPCADMNPPASDSMLLLPPRALRGTWQALQCARPFTR